MRVWVDGQCLQTTSRLRGIGRYVQELIRAIAENHPDVELLISFNAAMTSEAIAARDFIQHWVKPGNIHAWQGVCEGGEAVIGYSSRRRLSELALAHHVRCLDPDIALSASPFEGGKDVATPLLPGDLTFPPLAAIFYDAIPHRFSKNYLTSPRMESFYRRRLESHRCYAVNLCISNFSRAEALDLFPNVTSVNISAGLSADLLSAIKSRVGEHVQCPNSMYVLYVGGLDWRKNVALAIDAISLLPDKWRSQGQAYSRRSSASFFIGHATSTLAWTRLAGRKFYPSRPRLRPASDFSLSFRETSRPAVPDGGIWADRS